MFRPIHELPTGSLYILTGLPGSGKSHFAASARAGGTVWLLDTEGTAHTLQGKQGIHSAMEVVQTLSLRRLLAATEHIQRHGAAGDTVVLDSISKVLNAMRAYAQQRAGADTTRKASLTFDDHAAINRNLQTIYTALTVLKHAGFHVLIIGHLVRSYRAHGHALTDSGVDVLAGSSFAYEADAVLLLERAGTRRTLTPIVKPPRPSHLELDRRYAASLATLYPDVDSHVSTTRHPAQ